MVIKARAATENSIAALVHFSIGILSDKFKGQDLFAGDLKFRKAVGAGAQAFCLLRVSAQDAVSCV